MRTAFGLECDIQLRRWTVRAVDFLRRCGRDGQPRISGACNIYVEAVATGDPARGIDQHRRKPRILRRGKTHPKRSRFVQLATARHAINVAHIEPYGAPGPVGGENRGTLRCGTGLHPSNSIPTGPNSGLPRHRPSSQGHLTADFGWIEIASIAGIFHGAPVHDREIVAELAGKVEILLDEDDGDVAE